MFIKTPFDTVELRLLTVSKPKHDSFIGYRKIRFSIKHLFKYVSIEFFY